MGQKRGDRPAGELGRKGKRPGQTERERDNGAFTINERKRKDTQAMGLFAKVFGTRSQREVKALTATVDKIEALEEEDRKSVV